jgi:3D (Asp-Asp-Asp) domain-containing protein
MKVRILCVAVLLVSACFLALMPTTEAAQLGDRYLSSGMSGEDVRDLQSKLSHIGLDPGPVDGKYGPMTKSAVMLLQQLKQLPEDGVAGPELVNLLNEIPAGELSRGWGAPERYKRVFTARSTAYSPASAGGNITYSGTTVRRGVVAVDPRVIPMGTRMYVEGYGYAIAEDTGGAIKGNKIDVAFLSNYECYQWGVRDVTVYILD